MRDYKDLIQREAEKISQLHQLVHETAKERKIKPESWHKACEEFRNHKSQMTDILEQVFKQKDIVDKNLQEFVISFLELNPMYFRSGYTKEMMIQKIKRSVLTEKQKERLRAVVLDAIENRPQREFKRYCRLAIVIANVNLQSAIEVIVNHGEGSRKKRASMVLQCLKQIST